MLFEVGYSYSKDDHTLRRSGSVTGGQCENYVFFLAKITINVDTMARQY